MFSPPRFRSSFYKISCYMNALYKDEARRLVASWVPQYVNTPTSQERLETQIACSKSLSFHVYSNNLLEQMLL